MAAALTSGGCVEEEEEEVESSATRSADEVYDKRLETLPVPLQDGRVAELF